MLSHPPVILPSLVFNPQTHHQLIILIIFIFNVNFNLNLKKQSFTIKYLKNYQIITIPLKLTYEILIFNYR